MIFVDSSFIISLLQETDTNHIKAKKTWDNTGAEKIYNEDVLKEVLTVVSQRKGRNFAIDAFYDISIGQTILPVTTERFQAGLTLFLDPKLQKDISLIDCIIAATCNELKIRQILTFDPHFRKLELTPIPKS